MIYLHSLSETRELGRIVRGLASALSVCSWLVMLCASGAPGAGPDVLVLVLSGMGPFDQVSIQYATEIPKQEALRDIDTLVRETSWRVRDVSVRTASSSTPGARATTSSGFATPPLADSRDGTFPLEPFVLALKRFDTIRVNYIADPQFRFGGPKEFEDRWVKIDLKQSGNSYLYRVHVKDKGFRRLRLPLVQPKPAAPRRQEAPAWPRVLVTIGLALAASAVVYLVVARVSRRRGP